MNAPVKVRFVVLQGELDEVTAARIRAAISEPDTTVIHAVPTVSQIIDRVSYETGVSREAMIGRTHSKGAVRARFAAIWLAYRWAGKTTGQITPAFDDRDHATIGYAVAKAQAMRQRDPSFLALCDMVVAHFTGSVL
jgi:chromosomal replication initiation ATPase DnaA